MASLGPHFENRCPSFFGEKEVGLISASAPFPDSQQRLSSRAASGLSMRSLLLGKTLLESKWKERVRSLDRAQARHLISALQTRARLQPLWTAEQTSISRQGFCLVLQPSKFGFQLRRECHSWSCLTHLAFWSINRAKGLFPS